MLPLQRAAEGAELIISFGGDGTFLHVARQTLGMPIPLLGINVGTKGFMAGLEPEDIELVRRAAAGGFTAAPPRRNSRDRRAEAPSL